MKIVRLISVELVLAMGVIVTIAVISSIWFLNLTKDLLGALLGVLQ